MNVKTCFAFFIAAKLLTESCSLNYSISYLNKNWSPYVLYCVLQHFLQDAQKINKMTNDRIDAHNTVVVAESAFNEHLL